MVLSFFKLMKKPVKNNNNNNHCTIGQLLFCFLEFYGKLNYSQYVIDSKEDK